MIGDSYNLVVLFKSKNKHTKIFYLTNVIRTYKHIYLLANFFTNEVLNK